MALSDEIIILNDGHIEQQGSPGEIFDRPANTFVAEFIGSPRINLVDATLDGDALRLDGTDVRVPLEGRSLPEHVDSQQRLTLGIRPADMALATPSDDETLSGTVTIVEKLGQDDVAFLDCPELDAEVRVVTERSSITEGDSYDITFDPADIHLFDRDSGEAIRLESPPPATQ